MIDHLISFEQMEFGLFQKLSDHLNISFSELINIEPELAPVLDQQNIILGYAVSFGSEASGDILKKIKNLSRKNKVYVGFYVVNDLLNISKLKNKKLQNITLCPKDYVVCKN